MKKMYETPKAVKYEFNYLENVVASTGNAGQGKGKGKGVTNSCYTGNTASVPMSTTCEEEADPKFGY